MYDESVLGYGSPYEAMVAFVNLAPRESHALGFNKRDMAKARPRMYPTKKARNAAKSRRRRAYWKATGKDRTAKWLGLGIAEVAAIRPHDFLW